MKLWGVFTNFYDGITIDGREVLVSEYDTKDDALKEAIRYGLQILNHFKTDDFMNERLYGKQETIFYKGIMPSETGFRFSSGL